MTHSAAISPLEGWHRSAAFRILVGAQRLSEQEALAPPDPDEFGVPAAPHSSRPTPDLAPVDSAVPMPLDPESIKTLDRPSLEALALRLIREPSQTEPPAQDSLLNYAAAARYLSLPRGTLYNLVWQKRIPHIRISKRTVRFDRDDLARWLERRRVR